VFAAGLEIGVGQKQIAKYYAELIEWHMRTTQYEYNILGRCANAVNRYSVLASQKINKMSADIDALGDKIDRKEWQNVLERLYDKELADLYLNTSEACHLSQVELESIPRRPSFADTLGPVGVWTRWLLDTEQMPVVIIVGLVGFSLLGATVSRAVRLGPDRPAAMTFDDLLIVIAGGATAAVVVFLAAYGGLALLGSAGGDPNPYIVFVTCLIGAVYSEDVWAWARTRVKFPKPEDKGGETQDNVAPPQETAPVS
jgi:hypothetical protein